VSEERCRRERLTKHKGRGRMLLASLMSGLAMVPEIQSMAQERDEPSTERRRRSNPRRRLGPRTLASDQRATGGAQPDQGGAQPDERDDTMIPCDACDTMVRFCDYASHAERCGSRASVSPGSSIAFVFETPTGMLPIHRRHMHMHMRGRSEESQESQESQEPQEAQEPLEAQENENPYEGYDEEENDENHEPYEDQDAEAERRLHLAFGFPRRQVAPSDWGDISNLFATRATHERERLPNPTHGVLHENLPQANQYQPLAHVHDGLTRHVYEVMMGLMPRARTSDSYEINTLLGELLGRVEVGVQDIDTVAGRCESCPSEICPICQESLADETQCRRTVCRHAFCAACIERWFRTSKRCPVCMCDVEDAVAA